MRILGIDPGYAILGYGILDMKGNKFEVIAYGSILTDNSMEMPQRLKLLYDELSEIIRRYQPEEASIEELFFNTNVTTGISVAQARGVILLACYQAGVQVYEYTPLQVKQAVVGYGRAEKKQVMDMVKRILNLQDVPKPDDAADAVAIALCHARSSTSLLSQKGVNQTCLTI